MTQVDFNTVLNVVIMVGGAILFLYVRWKLHEHREEILHALAIAKHHGELTDNIHIRTNEVLHTVENKVEEVKQVAKQVVDKIDSESGTKLGVIKPT